MSYRTHEVQLKRVGAFAVAVAFGAMAAGCGDPEIPAAPETPRASAISIEPPSANLSSLGERATFRATITDQYGATFPGTATWSSSNEAVFAVEARGTVVAAANGTGALTAAFEGLTASAGVVVQQAPESLVAVLEAADQPGTGLPATGLVLVPAEASAWPVAVRVLDAGGSPVAGVAVTFTPGEGHGVADPETATTDHEGIAQTEWTPGPADGMHTLTAAYSGGPSVQVAATGATDRAALTALYNATGGPSWTRRDNWLSSNPLSDWYGVRVDTDGRVTSLALGGNNLTDSLPSQIGDLTSLGILQLYNNKLTGPIPAEIGKLVNLEILFLEDNEFSGRLPSELGQLTSAGMVLDQGQRKT